MRWKGAPFQRRHFQAAAGARQSPRRAHLPFPKEVLPIVEITVGGISIAVEKKRIKNIYLRIKPDGSVHLSAPRGMSDAAIRAFAASRLDWIGRHRQRLRPLPPPPQYADGEIFLLWGRPCPLRVVSVPGRCSAGLEDGFLVLRAAPESTLQQRKAAVDAWYRAQLLAAIPAVRRECEAIVGQRAAQVRVRDMRTRWGTCNVAQRRVWLSLQLAQKPPECLRCVMLHELTHLWESRHSPRFWALMDRFCPDWRAIHRLLGGPHAN